MKEMKINVPEGHEIDTERSDLSKGEIYFREKNTEFREGHWIAVDHFLWKDKRPHVLPITEIRNGKYYSNDYHWDAKSFYALKMRHATPSEIAEAKERIREKELPKRWEDLKKVNGYFVDDNNEVYPSECLGLIAERKNVWPTREEAEASIALAQLSQLWKVYGRQNKEEFVENFKDLLEKTRPLQDLFHQIYL